MKNMLKANDSLKVEFINFYISLKIEIYGKICPLCLSGLLSIKLMTDYSVYDSMRLLLFISCLFLLGTTHAQHGYRTLIPDQLEGTWVRDMNWNPYSFRYVRSDSIIKNQRAFIFKPDGKVSIYSEFGCQLPPHFKFREADWWVSGRHEISIDWHFPGEKPDRLKVILLREDEFRFSYD
jgi:hypothetical protein